MRWRFAYYRAAALSLSRRAVYRISLAHRAYAAHRIACGTLARYRVKTVGCCQRHQLTAREKAIAARRRKLLENAERRRARGGESSWRRSTRIAASRMALGKHQRRYRRYRRCRYGKTNRRRAAQNSKAGINQTNGACMTLYHQQQAQRQNNGGNQNINKQNRIITLGSAQRSTTRTRLLRRCKRAPPREKS